MRYMFDPSGPVRSTSTYLGEEFYNFKFIDSILYWFFHNMCTYFKPKAAIGKEKEKEMEVIQKKRWNTKIT